MCEVSGEKVWQKLCEDEEFQKQLESVREVMRPFVEALPMLLGELLDTPVTLVSICQAKVKFLRYCLEHDFISKAYEATPEEALGFFTREIYASMLENTFNQLIDLMEEQIPQLPTLLQRMGLAEQDHLLDSAGFREEARELYLLGELIVGRLLLVQPMIIVKNSE